MKNITAFIRDPKIREEFRKTFPNPKHKFSKLIGGNGDLIIDDTLIEVKTTKDLVVR